MDLTWAIPHNQFWGTRKGSFHRWLVWDADPLWANTDLWPETAQMQRDVDKRLNPSQTHSALALTHLQLPDGPKPVHFIFPQFHVFPQNLLALPGLRFKINSQIQHLLFTPTDVKPTSPQCHSLPSPLSDWCKPSQFSGRRVSWCF